MPSENSASDEILRAAHYKNYSAVESGLKQAKRATRRAIAEGAVDAVKSLTLAEMMLVAIKAEARLMKLLYLPDGFAQRDRDTILAMPTVYERWIGAVDLAYRKGFGMHANDDISLRLKHDDTMRYATLQRVLNSDLKPIIEIRNKLAHGQWARPLTNDRKGIATDACQFIGTENAMLLGLRDAALSAIANIIGDLIQSVPLYRSRFDSHFVAVQKVERSRSKSYEDWQKQLRRRYLSGVQHHLTNRSSTVDR